MTPSFQFNKMGIKDETVMWKDILKVLSREKGYVMRIGTGYLNLVRFFRKGLAKVKHSKICFICPAPESNTFIHAKGIKLLMPPAIRMNIFNYAREMGPNVKFFEYKRRLNLDNDQSIWDICTFHMKGIWLTQGGERGPQDTVIGSSNYNFRSFHHDTEISYYISTQDKEFMELMRDEVRLLYKYANDDISQGTRNGLYKSMLSLPHANWKTFVLYKAFHLFI